MMSGFSSVAVCLTVLSTVSAGNVAPNTNVSPSVGKQLLRELRSMEQTLTSENDELKGILTSKQQPVPYSTRLQAIENKLMALDTKLAATEAKQNAAEKVLETTGATLETYKSMIKSGSTYVRWGRKSCSNASQLVYSGIAGGSLWSHHGAAANPLCLTLTPQTDGTRVPPGPALLYGAEYQELFNHHDHDVPCSVCLAPQLTTIMIPTTHTCPNGWTTQYRGHLSAGHVGHNAASQYVCLDKDPENAPGGRANYDGYLFYLTATRCGSLPCPPYGNNQVVLCVVCSK